MKRILSILTSVAVLALATPSFAYPKPVEKLKGGLTTVITSPLEIKDNVEAEYTKAKFMPFGLVGGMLKGGFYMAKDMVTGAIDVVTFPIDR